jgi:membrane-associated phospholipid phosphatase
MSSQPVPKNLVKTRQLTWQNQILPVLSSVQLSLFGLLTWVVRRHPVLPIDIRISRRLQKYNSPILRYGTVAVSNCNKAGLLDMLVIPLATALWLARLRLEAVMTAGTCLTATLLRLVLRQSINRPRPSPPLVKVRQKPHGKSFPSGHVISAVNFWGWLFVVGTTLLKGQPDRQKVVLIVPLLVVLLVGPSRIYLGDHWASDVLGGYLFGSSWFSLSLRLYQVLKNRGVMSS